jgi:methylenetetrahydrofolate reductase (NADPH)
MSSKNGLIPPGFSVRGRNSMTLREKITRGQFVVTAEMSPPQGADGDIIRKKAVHFHKGVDGVNITDNQTAIVRLSSIAAAKIAIEEGLEPIIQMTCRDRNRIAIQSDLLGASALGIENILCLTGDHQKFGNHPEARSVFDLDSIQLIAAARRLTEGYFLSGETIKKPPVLFVGGAANPFSDPLDFRVIRLDKKIQAGAQFIQTQPVYDLDRFLEWMEGVRSQGLEKKTAILAGVMPVKSVKALLHIENEVPGIRIPKACITRMEKAADQKEEGIKMAVEMILALREIDGVQGIHLMPLMWESVTPRILDEAGLLNR